MKEMILHTSNISDLDIHGYAIGEVKGKPAHIWSALPGEEVEAQIIKKKKGAYECIARNIIKPSPDRIEPLEDHYLSCSPWSVMTFEAENRYKKELALNLLKSAGVIGRDVDAEIDFDNRIAGYRNKMEYSFVKDENGKTCFAFFQRSGRKRIPIDVCSLADGGINFEATKIINWIRDNQIPEESLKSLILRSDGAGHVIAGLFVKDEIRHDEPDLLDEQLTGFHIYLSSSQCPASIVSEVLYSSGADSMTSVVRGEKLSFGLNSFFQVNIPMFERTMHDIAPFIEKGSPVVDYFCGTGSISLSASDKSQPLQLVDLSTESIEYARKNIAANGFTQAVATNLPAEKAVEHITSDSIVIFDPPRAGLHPDIIERILLVKPKRIVYLSCNVATQARDIALIKSAYDIKLLKFYNYFPRTPHIEGLCVMETI